MPNRILREGILTSERVNALSWEAEVFYRRLMSAVDDFGRFHAHPALLRAALYPLKLESVREAGMERLLADVEQASLIRLYEVAGKRYLEMQDFRQQVRAKESKYPAPPGDAGAGWAPAQHAPGKCLTHAHLGGGGAKGAVEVKDESAGAGAGPRKEKDSAAPPMHVQLALALRGQGVAITSAHPNALAWAEQGVSVAQALEAVSIARLRKPQGSIAPNYLSPILADILNPPANAKREPAWWASEADTLAKGRELGIQANPGEAMGEYRARLNAALERKGGKHRATA